VRTITKACVISGPRRPEPRPARSAVDRARGGLALLASAFAIPMAFAATSTITYGAYVVMGLLAIALGVVTLVPLVRRNQ
jgi:hypothetical protein